MPSDGLVFEALYLQFQQRPLEVMGTGPGWKADSREDRPATSGSTFGTGAHRWVCVLHCPAPGLATKGF